MTILQVENNDINTINQLLDLAKSKLNLKITILNNVDSTNFDNKQFDENWIEYEKATKEDIIAFNNSSHWKDWVEAFEFLESLMKK